MTKKEITERGLVVDDNGKVTFANGHEYRNESGGVEYVEDEKKTYIVEIMEAHGLNVKATSKAEAQQKALNFYNGGNMHQDLKFKVKEVKE